MLSRLILGPFGKNKRIFNLSLTSIEDILSTMFLRLNQQMSCGLKGN